MYMYVSLKCTSIMHIYLIKYMCIQARAQRGGLGGLNPPLLRDKSRSKREWMNEVLNNIFCYFSTFSVLTQQKKTRLASSVQKNEFLCEAMVYPHVFTEDEEMSALIGEEWKWEMESQARVGYSRNFKRFWNGLVSLL